MLLAGVRFDCADSIRDECFVQNLQSFPVIIVSMNIEKVGQDAHSPQEGLFIAVWLVEFQFGFDCLWDACIDC